MKVNWYLHLLPVSGISIFTIGISLGYAMLDNVSFLNDDFSNLAKGQTEILFVASTIISVLLIFPYLYYLYVNLSKQGRKILFDLSLTCLILSFPSLLGLLIFNTYQDTAIHVLFTRLFYFLGGTSIVLWAIGLQSIPKEADFKKYWNYPNIDPYIILIFIIILLLLNFFKFIDGPIRQKLGIFGFMIILFYINIKLYIIEKRRYKSISNSVIT